jgi:hypothetical protein
MLEAALERLDRLIPLGRESARSAFSSTNPSDEPLAEGGERS